ncbi:hypothetical protein [Glycomyces buryatensis]|uniref:Uncharacterized protein n=1 Tax=Glycomyces buryatensis TaxID=2570927 RepID=A0A4V4HR55_9ACTN|nr:hypothetical protein [Glycomyces buryatensis]THV36476.1 hypothetical protein FAB82_22100 [Glycomyces buryatensis]
MPTATLIDGPALGALLNRHDFAPERLPPALWLPADHPDDERSLLAALRSSWENCQWYGMGTWFAPGTAAEPPPGMADRYADLQRDLIAEGSLTTPQGLRVRSEWSTLDPRSSAVHEFLRATRAAGSCLSLAAQGTSPRAWYAASTALLHRALTVFGGLGDLDRREVDDSATLTYLASGPAAGYASLIPLDLHPWGGCVVAGDATFLSVLRESLPDPLPGLAEVSWEHVVGRAGGLAL